ncbi:MULTISPECIES: AraC family transcriptional regulator [unclassified Sinorhizobium]|uniref:helix-turn-helix transcriptional regulator n=1 Tax=unclassified Sinorhizobium TaxID=2613772 RepID=UPI0024C2A741|nr:MULTISPECIES: AraC family transcriptional regulator [unclassified Sinorhizobium]MDK1378286.1 AraC family transcriptional regulator [Sinorhizobium sp. 6-70]MDK1482271.1 AraC family transcriptional regulator [Sinorhizobium sp. 6-117]
MIDTDEFVRRLNQGRRWQVQRAEGNDAIGSYRFLPPAQSASGHVDGYFDYQNPCLTIRKLKAKHEFYDDEPGLGRLAFVLHLSGWRRIELGSAHQHELTKPTLAVLYQPRGMDKRSIWRSGAHETSLSVGIWPERLTSLFGFHPNCFPNFSGAEVESSEAFWYSRPLPYALMAAAEKLLNPNIHPLLFKRYISIKAQELLCLSLSTLLSDGEFLSRRDLALNRVEHVKTMVDANLTNPPSLSELATSLGVSAQALSDEMYKQMGVSYTQYITERRMNRAMLLLENGGTPLKQVAYEVGYGHTSNFCTAFKRHFGITPKDARGL